jgi:hypothetical protein
MAKNKISDYSATPANNTDINNIDIAEGCSPSGINNAIRELMADLKDWQAGSESGQALAVVSGGTGAETATDARTNLSAAKSGANSDITSLSGLTTPLSVAQGGTGVQVTRTISNVALTSNVVTITTSAAHGYLVNDSVTVTATTQTTVNGTFTIASVPTTTTFTYAKTASDIPSTTDTGSVVSSSNIKMANASGILAVVNGGTGASTLKANNLLVGNGTSSPSVIPAGTAGNVLVSSTTSTVTAGSFAVGTEYTIASIGTTATDFMAIGAASNTVGVVFTATGVGTGNGTATTNTWGSGTYTPAALSTASGSAPSYSARAWARFNATSSADLSATYSQSGTTVTVTATSHGLYVGNKVYINITSGTGVDGTYTVSSVANANTFTYTAGTSLTTSGTASLQFRAVNGAGNIGRVSYIAEGRYVINFVTAMPDTNYVVNGNSGLLGSFSAAVNGVIAIIETNTGCVLIQNSDPSANTYQDYDYNAIQVIR